MTKKTRFGRRSAVAAVVASAGLLVGAGAAHAAGLSCAGLPAAGVVTSNPIACAVNCAAGGTLASAVALKPRTTSRLTITVSGACVASTDDLPGGITIQGASSSAALQAPSATTDPVLGISGTGVQLAKLTIRGGVHALRGRSGSAFTATSIIVEGASEADVLLDHAVATFNTSTIENSAGDGIDANFGSTVFLNGGIVQKNAITGVNAVYDGSADIFGGAVLQNNGIRGAGSGYGGTVLVSAGTITKNGFAIGGVGGMDSGTGGHLVVEGSSTSVSSNDHNGILVDDGGTALVQNGVTIGNNNGNGLVLVQGGFAKVRLGAVVQGNTANGIYVEIGTVTVGDGAGPATIQNNNGNGLLMRTNSVANLGSSSNKITGNAGWGILCTGAPSNPLIFGAIGMVTGNTKGQIACKVAP